MTGGGDQFLRPERIRRRRPFRVAILLDVSPTFAICLWRGMALLPEVVGECPLF